MAKRIEHISGRVKLRSSSDLDSSRYTYLSLDQAEPNLGAPDSAGSLVISALDGTRSFTTAPTLSGLSFQVGGLDSADTSSLYSLFIKGSPLDGTIDSVGYRRLDGSLFEVDTLDTVTGRGSVTSNSIQIGTLVADSASFSGDLVVSGQGSFAGDVVVSGNLTINGTETILNSTTLTVNDKNIVLADSAPNAAAADSAGITIAGANAQFFYKSGTDTWNLNKKTVFDSDIDVGNKLFIGNVDSRSTTLSLFIDESTGEVVASASPALVADTVTVVDTNLAQEHHLLFTLSSSGADSVNTDLNLTYNAGLSRLTLGQLILNDLSSQPTETTILSIDDNNVIGFREIASILGQEVDTLDTVTTRGDSTDNAIIVKKITTTDSAYVGSDLQFGGQFLDASGRRLVIYDSAGAILWG